MTPSPPGADNRANLIGAAWMVVAMAGFAVEDSLLKAAAQTLPVAQVLILFGAGGAAIFAGLAWRQGNRFFTRDSLSPAMGVRMIFEVTGRLFYTLSIALTPLSAATVILQATPLVVVAGAALLFGEQVGWRRWLAILIGLLGVVVIVQPGGESFSAFSLLAVLGLIGFAGRDLASRAAPASVSTWILGLYGFVGLIIAGGLVALWEQAPFVTPSAGTGLILLAAVCVGVFSYSGLMKAMRTGEVSAVTPFRYTRLLFGIVLGVLVFEEELTQPMLIGAGLIVASGLFILWRGRRV